MRNVTRQYPIPVLLVMIVAAFAAARWFFEFDWELWFLSLSLAAFLVWVALLGVGWHRVERNSIVIIREGYRLQSYFRRPRLVDKTTVQASGQAQVRPNLWQRIVAWFKARLTPAPSAQTLSTGKQSGGRERLYYLLTPFTHLEASLPAYPIRYEAEVDEIDTNTKLLSRINKITVRIYCRIDGDNAVTFYERSLARLDRLKELEESMKLHRTDHALWEQFLREVVIRELVDDVVREVVWQWPGSDNDPTSLSKDRLNLAKAIQKRLARDLQPWGLKLMPRETDHQSGNGHSSGNGVAPQPAATQAPAQPAATPAPVLGASLGALDLARDAQNVTVVAAGPPATPSTQAVAPVTPSSAGATNGKSVASKEEGVAVVLESIVVAPELVKAKTRDYQAQLKRATEEATVEAAGIRAKGFAEAEVRARNLALVLDELLNNRRLPITDKLVTDVVRAAMYSDGEMIWKGVIEKSATGDGKAKTA